MGFYANLINYWLITSCSLSIAENKLLILLKLIILEILDILALHISSHRIMSVGFGKKCNFLFFSEGILQNTYLLGSKYTQWQAFN